jgi:AraC-like DNA-binding protein
VTPTILRSEGGFVSPLFAPDQINAMPATFVEVHSPPLEQMASIADLSSYHFARQFKATTGLPPHQYVIARRIERAQHLLQRDGELGLVEVALRVGFAHQSHFSFHFKRIVGVTPGQFRISDKNPIKSASPRKKSCGWSISLLLKQGADQPGRAAVKSLN